jgi:hypothetical protein
VTSILFPSISHGVIVGSATIVEREFGGHRMLFFSSNKQLQDHNKSVNLLQEIAELEAELQVKDALFEKQNKLLQHWQGLLEAQKDIHIEELKRV